VDCPEEFRVFVDANLTALGSWLATRDPRFLHIGHSDWPLSADAPDEDWLDFVGRCGLAVLIRDRYRTREKAKLREHGITAVVVAVSRNLTLAEQQRLIAEHWDAIIDTLTGGVPGIHHLTTSGVRLMETY